MCLKSDGPPMSALVSFLFLSFFPFFVTVTLFVTVACRTAVDFGTDPLVVTGVMGFPVGCCCDKRRRSKQNNCVINEPLFSISRCTHLVSPISSSNIL